MLDRNAIADYEDFLLGKRKMVLRGDANEKESTARALVRYAVTELLHWTPSEAIEKMDANTVARLKLDTIFRYISFPKDLDEKNDFDYILCICFGRPFDPRNQVDRILERIRGGLQHKFPKGYSEGDAGAARIAHVMHQLTAERFAGSTMEELYEFYSDYSKINTLFHEQKIYDLCHNRFREPLSCFHQSLSEEERDPFWYAFYQYRNVAGEIEKLQKREDREKARAEERRAREETRKQNKAKQQAKAPAPVTAASFGLEDVADGGFTPIQTEDAEIQSF